MPDLTAVRANGGRIYASARRSKKVRIFARKASEDLQNSLEKMLAVSDSYIRAETTSTFNFAGSVISRSCPAENGTTIDSVHESCSRYFRSNIVWSLERIHSPSSVLVFRFLEDHITRKITICSELLFTRLFVL